MVVLVHCRFPSMDHHHHQLLVILGAILYSCPCPSIALIYTVGDSTWSIPLTNHFYNNWSSSHSFHIGDSLLFEFESDLHNVMQVSRREYKSCTANSPFKAFKNGPAIVPLLEDGVFYFICSLSNYCALGQKLTVTVNETSPSSSSSAPSQSAHSPVAVSESVISGWSQPSPVCSSLMPSSAGGGGVLLGEGCASTMPILSLVLGCMVSFVI